MCFRALMRTFLLSKFWTKANALKLYNLVINGIIAVWPNPITSGQQIIKGVGCLLLDKWLCFLSDNLTFGRQMTSDMQLITSVMSDVRRPTVIFAPDNSIESYVSWWSGLICNLYPRRIDLPVNYVLFAWKRGEIFIVKLYFVDILSSFRLVAKYYLLI